VETNQYSQDSTDGNVQTGKPKAKKQKVKNKSMQKATKEDTIQTEKELQQIIKKRIIEYIPRNLMEVLQTEVMCNHIVNDITTHYNRR
jgi:ribosomal protein L17